MKTILQTIEWRSAILVAVMLTVMQSVDASENLARKYNCVACHAVERRMVGPSFQEVAARYSNKAVAQLAASIRKGGAGKWGAMPMPAYPQLSEADATALAKYVLDVK